MLRTDNRQGINDKHSDLSAASQSSNDSQADNKAAAPSLSLPKGGGAIQGIGEKFSTNPVTGTASFSIPIYASPGRSGFGPQLSLSYDSGNGNGPFGFGWALSLPSITRKTDKGLPKYQDVLESDVFILSGSEDLVPQFKKNEDGSWATDTDGNHLIDEVEREEGYVVRYYRPRIEGLFARIERWTKQADGDVHWRSISKDNILTVYGRDENSRIADPSDSSRIFSWLICESYDDKGNAIVYKYASENGNGVNLSRANERNRVRYAQRYIKTIEYGNRKSLLDLNHQSFRKSHLELINDLLSFSEEDWMFKVVFDYGEGHYEVLPLEEGLSEQEQHRYVKASANIAANDDNGDGGTDDNNISRSEWPVRPDPFSSYRSGFEVRTYRRCLRVLMFHNFRELGDKPYLVRNTEFDYSDLDYGVPTNSAEAVLPVKTELEHKGSTRLASFITSVSQSGYVLDERKTLNELGDSGYQGIYLKKSLPPIEFEYSKPSIGEEVKDIDHESLENLPYGLDGTEYQWADLDGEGISGILAQQDGAWFYKRNQGEGKFGPMERVATIPSLTAGGASSSGSNNNNIRPQFMDLDGNGELDAVFLAGGTINGFYERKVFSPYKKDEQDSWQNFRPFLSLPNISWQDQNLKFVDLTGDGHADLLLTKEDGVFTWYQSLAEQGFGPSERVVQSLDEEKGAPRLVFDDGTQSIFLTDMSGDGLSDLVRIRNGEICYWPNLGYGRFGNKVTMDNSPWFDMPDQFSPSRIRLADIDGTGVTDVIHFGADGIRIYFNQSGNSWSEPYSIPNFPAVNDGNLSSIHVLDLLGSGTSFIVWSSPLPSDSGRQMRYMDLLEGKKPHLLVGMRNNLGAETKVFYSSSTKFYLEDKARGEPWICKLPFPVHVVERVETYDYISRNLFVTRYVYHHGYFDGIEREFRGFGMVEQLDTEQFATLSSDDTFPTADNIDISSHVPPVRTKIWSHTGIHIGRDHVSDFFAGLLDEGYRGEYYREPAWQDDPEEARRHLLEDTILPSGLTIEEERQACRALKGKMLRQEVYGLDGSEKEQHPYTVIEQSFAIKMLQPCGKNPHAVFLVHEHEAINYHYERNPSDPRISHELMLEVDDFGNVLKQAAIGYGRLPQPIIDPELLEQHNKQTRSLVTYTENQYTIAVIEADSYRAPAPCGTSTYELTGYSPTGPAGRFQDIDFVEPDPNSDGSLRHIFEEEINYEDEPTTGKQRRLIEQVRTIYRKNDLTDLLPLGELQSLVLPGDSYKLAFTPGLLKIYERPAGEGQPPENLLPDPASVLSGQGADRGGYIQSQELKAAGYFPNSDPDEYWWVPSGKIFYSEDSGDTAEEELAYAIVHLFTPMRYLDPFDNESVVTMDKYDLLIVETRDPLGNRVTAGERNDESGDIDVQGNDYRTLRPHSIMDANGNRMEVVFDALGMVVATAVMGKRIPAPAEGDSLEDFDIYDSNLTEDVILNNMENPFTDPYALLKRATTRLVYDLFAYYRTNDLDRPMCAAVYSIIRETHEADLEEGARTKVQHSFSYSDGFGREIQKKIQAEPGPLDSADPNSTILNPRWVGSGWTIYNNKGKPVRKYEPFFSDTHRFEFRHIVGVSQVLFYDPVGRVVATLHPNHSYEKVMFDPWHQETWDVNDTVLLSPESDEDVKGFFLQDDDDGTSRLPADLYLPTWHDLRTDPAFDTEANERWPDTRIRNAEKQAAEKTEIHANTPATAYFDSLGRIFLTVAHNKWVDEKVVPPETIEERYSTRVSLDIEGNQREVKDAKDRIVMLYDYNMLGDRIKQESMDAGRRWMLNDVAGNPLFLWDSRGHAIGTSYDKLRRALEVRLQSSEPAVNKRVELFIYGESEGHERNHRGKVFRHFDEAGLVTNVEYDFKGNLRESNRRLATNYKEVPDWPSSDPEMSELDDETFSSSTAYDALNRPIRLITYDENITTNFYNEGGLLERVEMNIHGAASPTTIVRDLNYNAKGQRVLVEYGNGIVTSHNYDSETFRLIQMTTLRGSEHLQALSYVYDPTGNIIHIQDDADILNTVFFHNHRVEPSADYSYDALYRLIEASGREHLGLTDTGARRPPSPTTFTDQPRVNLQHPNDGNLMENYRESYSYDSVGNILQMEHEGGDPSLPGWTRSYNYNKTSFLEADKTNNQLSSTEVNSETEEYSYDVHGNMTEIPHLSIIRWNFRDELQASSKQHITNGGTPETTYYIYDHAGQRVRKVTELQAGEGETPRRKDERIYAGNFEIYRRYGGDGIDIALERETLHVSDSNNQRIAIIDTRTRGDDDCPQESIRYQLSSHLGSSSLELDEEANIISYEEYYPYGSTSYQAGRDICELNFKRYRYVGKERDEETGLYYYGARYYGSWLGIWMSADPSGLRSGLNLYRYARNNPIALIDTDGRKGEPAEGTQYFEFEEAEVDIVKPGSGGLMYDAERHHYYYGQDEDYWVTEGDPGLLAKEGNPAAESAIARQTAQKRENFRNLEATLIKGRDENLKRHAWEAAKSFAKGASLLGGPVGAVGTLIVGEMEAHEKEQSGDLMGAAQVRSEATTSALLSTVPGLGTVLRGGSGHRRTNRNQRGTKFERRARDYVETVEGNKVILEGEGVKRLGFKKGEKHSDIIAISPKSDRFKTFYNIYETKGSRGKGGAEISKAIKQLKTTAARVIKKDPNGSIESLDILLPDTATIPRDYKVGPGGRLFREVAGEKGVELIPERWGGIDIKVKFIGD